MLTALPSFLAQLPTPYLSHCYSFLQGPVLPQPLVTPADIKRLISPVNAEGQLGYVFKALTLTRQKLAGKVPLIGFSGAPVSEAHLDQFCAHAWNVRELHEMYVYFLNLTVDIDGIYD